VDDVRDPLGIPTVADGGQQPLVRFVHGIVVGAQHEGVEAAVAIRRHDLGHLDAVGFDGELLVALEHLADQAAVNDQHRTERRLKELPLPADLLQHRIRLEFQEESDDGPDRSTLTERLDLECLELLDFGRCEGRRSRLASQLPQSSGRDRVVGGDAIDGGEERLQCCSRVSCEKAEIRRGRIARPARRCDGSVSIELD
jgi:hypothetical protein